MVAKLASLANLSWNSLLIIEVIWPQEVVDLKIKSEYSDATVAGKILNIHQNSKLDKIKKIGSEFFIKLS